MHGTPQLIFADADDFATNKEPAIVVLSILREHIETGYAASLLERLHILTDSAEKTRLYRDSVAISVDGYDEDPRELCEIPEVREYFQKVTTEWPHWLWFLNREMGSVSLIISMLCKVKVEKIEGGFNTHVESIPDMVSKVSDLFFRGNALFYSFGITVQEANESAASALAVLNKGRLH